MSRAAEAVGLPSGRRRVRRERILSAVAPYALVAPTLLVIGAVLGYPLYFLAKLSFQHYGLPELIQHHGRSAGLANYSSILHDSFFWRVLLRTVVFTVVNVGATMILGTLVALLLARLGRFMRILVTSSLVLAWSMPVIVAVQVWYWMTNQEFGVLNWALTELHLGDFNQHDWFANPITGLGVIAALIVWGAIPFVALTLYAGLTQVPGDLVEAASIDGAGAWRTFRDVTFPLLKPIFVILTSLSIIWDFQVFNQVFLMRFSRPTEDYYLMSIYAYERSFGISEYGLGAAIAVVTVLTLLFATFFYVRQMVRVGEVQ